MTTTEEARQRYSQKLEKIRTSNAYTPVKKRALMSQAWVESVETIRDLKTQQEQAAKARHKTLESKLFGLPAHATSSDQLSYRDAYSRAHDIPFSEEEKAVALMQHAERSGDAMLAKATLAVAYERGWVDAINVYANAHEELDTDINELWRLSEHSDDFSDFTYSDPEKPTELQNFAEFNIRKFATADEDGYDRPDEAREVGARL